MALSHHSAGSQPVTPSGPDVSRYRLKQLANWIRDDLDVLVARNGPDVLRPDDVVTLHESFVGLRQCTTITALDLRATGIHKALKDIAGIATRWPGRLCDDCDKIIALWTSKFGPLDELHPFLYGRGGRLEGIASLSEYSRESLIKRWTRYCPDKIDANVAHRQGDLGFRAGDWWISPLFAHHAGIIGLASVEGGMTYDQNGAYALVLKDVGDVEARDEDTFVYRFATNDKGRFRLTAATPKSREPIRVLRSHSVNSTWGPKAGIRYEGLYSIKGWRIRQAKLNDTLAGDWKEGEILYEVTLQRNDPVPMEEVIRRPTIMEADDYAEYKRLRKLQRGGKRNGLGLLPTMPDAGSILPALQMPVSPSVAPQSLLRMSPSLSRTATFKELAFDTIRASQGPDKLPGTDVISPMTVPDQQDPFVVPKKVAGHVISSKGGMASTANSSNSASLASTLPDKSVRDSRASVPRSMKDDLKEILPWMELEDQSLTAPSSDALAAANPQSVVEIFKRLQTRAAGLNPVKSVRLAVDTRLPSSIRGQQIQEIAEEDMASDTRNVRLYQAKLIRRVSNEKDKYRSMHKAPGKQPGFFDGAEYCADEEDDTTRSRSLTARRLRSSSADGPRLQSLTLISPPKANSLYKSGIEDIEFASPLDNLTPRNRMASPVNSFMSSSVVCPSHGKAAGESIAFSRLKRWLSK